MAKTEVICAQCGRVSEKETGAVNRALRDGFRIFCGRACSGLGRRAHKTDETKREEKRRYDAEYRATNRALLKVKKANYHKRSYDPAQASIARQRRMPRHLEYCRQAEYRAWKQAYDRKYQAKKSFGPFWESAVLNLQIREDLLSQMTDYEIRLTKYTLNKKLQRRREYDRAFSKEPEVGPLGNLERSSRG